MPSDRDQAQQWLAETITPACAGADCWPRAVQEIAAAILDTPGVEVDIEVGLITQAGAWILADDHYGIPATHRRPVIRLPAQPIGETPDVPL